MSEKGKVTSLDPATNVITIDFDAHGACKSCGVCLIGKGSDHVRMQVKALNTLDARIGNMVEFEVKEGEMFKASMWLYGFPMAMLLLGFMIGRKFAQLFGWSEDMIGLLVACIGFVGAFYYLAKREQKNTGAESLHVQLLKIIE